MGEEEALKRNTDCVYFLASPLTCKKGVECEYRHSESARLNPRDCWYWLAGNCQNPVCAFRHPPLDARPETSSEHVFLPNQASMSISKNGIPCYFYFNGFCNRGENCSFLHGPKDVTPAWRSTKTTSAVASVHVVDSNASRIDDRVSLSKEAPSNSLVTLEAMENVQLQSNVAVEKLVSHEVVEQQPSPQLSSREDDGMLAKSEALLSAEDVIEGGSLSCGEQSPEEQADGHVDPEEWWESSPGFDVLVDDGSENLGYEDDQKYLLDHEREANVLHHHLLQYDYEDSLGYDSIEYSNAGLQYEQEMDLCASMDNEHIPEYGQRVSKLARETMQDSMLIQKRRFSPREVKHGNRNGVDLRDHLRKRRKMEGQRGSNYLKRRGLSHLSDRSQETPEWKCVKGPTPHGRLASEVGKNTISSELNCETSTNDGRQQGWQRHSNSRHIRSRLREKERRRESRPKSSVSKTSGRIASRVTVPQDSTSFSGPKTLAQIKEEKRKTMENRDGFGNTNDNRTASKDFEGTKPRYEVLH